MSFKVGDIIKGVRGNGYSATNFESLLMVINDDGEDMQVKILYHASQYSQIGRTYYVDNDDEKFKIITFEEYLTEYPNCYKCSNDRLEIFLDAYVNPQQENETYVLSDEMRAELIEEMKTLLTRFRYQPTEMALNKILDEWCKNKGNLIRMFEKHPNYNGKFQITFDMDFDRTIDRNAVNNFRWWLLSEDVRKSLLREVKKGVFTYTELVEICQRLYNKYRLFERFDDIREINGKTYKEYTSEYAHFKKYQDNYEYDENIVTWNCKAYDRTSYNNYENIGMIDDILYSSSTLEQFVNDSAKNYFANYFPNAKIKKGQKLSRAVNKILTMVGLDKHKDYNKEFAKFADAINPLKLKRHTVISIHPIDYFTMSFGNSWSSCHTIDKENDRGIASDSSWRGCNSSGTMSYMLDESSCIFYTIDAAYNGNTLELEDKINRCMFHYNDGQLVQGRVYPQSNDSGSNGLYKDIREIVQKVFADMLEVPNYWTNKGGTDECSNVISSKGTHYKDYENFDNCNVSTLKDDKVIRKMIKVGHYPICPHCGTEHSRTKNIECSSCSSRN